MRIVQVIAGTGDMYCGSCLRDQMLSRALRVRGHEVLVMPLYLPMVGVGVDDRDESGEVSPIFFGGINVYLQQKSAVFRHLPVWITRWMDNPGLLRWVSRRATMTKADELGEMTVSMLRGEQGRQVKALDEMVDWLVKYYGQDSGPDVVILANAMLIGLARRIKERLKCAVVCTLQGEDGFLDALKQPHRDEAWGILAERGRDVDRFVAISRYYAQVMGTRMDIAEDKLAVVYNGIELEGFEKANSQTSTEGGRVIGYLARMCQEKGLHLLVDVFIELKKQPEFDDVKLKVAGAVTAGDKSYVAELERKLLKAGLPDEVELKPNIDNANKFTFLKSLTVMCVPAEYGEAFGLYVLEALAAGVPVVEPESGALVELLEETKGGILYQPGNVKSLADALSQLLVDESLRYRMGRQGRAVVKDQFTASQMAVGVEDVCEQARRMNRG